jgi:hypothetical protein
MNYTHFPKQDHLPEYASPDNQVKKLNHILLK